MGGALTAAFGWRALFVINVPVGVALLVGVLRTVPALLTMAGRRLDVIGALLATGSLVALTYGLTTAGAAGWGSTQTCTLLGVAAVGLAAFVVTQRVVREPLVPLAVFRRRPLVAALVLMVLGWGRSSPASSSPRCTSSRARSLGAAHRGGVPADRRRDRGGRARRGPAGSRFGVRAVIATGLAVGAAGAVTLSNLTPESSYLVGVLPGFLLLGIGGGTAAAGVMIAALAGVDEKHAGVASGLTNTHELSIALTLPVLATVAARSSGWASLGAEVDLDALTRGLAACPVWPNVHGSHPHSAPRRSASTGPQQRALTALRFSNRYSPRRGSPSTSRGICSAASAKNLAKPNVSSASTEWFSSNWSMS